MIVASPKPIAEIKRPRRQAQEGALRRLRHVRDGVPGRRRARSRHHGLRHAHGPQARRQAHRDRAGDHRAPVRERVHQGPGRRPSSATRRSSRSPAARASRPWPSGSPASPSTPALNTQFLGILEEQAVWTEKCLGCGDCMLAEFGGICPVTRCAKRMLNGPCGGSTEEHCEVDPDRPCAWQLIYKRLQGHRPAGPAGGDPSRPRTGARPGTAARGRSCARSTGSDSERQV